MRILLWTEYYLPHIGGVERHAELLMRELSARGHQFIVITTRYDESLPEEEQRDGIPIYRLPLTTSIMAANLPALLGIQKRLKQILNDFEPDLYHVFGTGVSMLGLLPLIKQYPAPLIVRLAATIQEPQKEYHEKTLFGKVLTLATWVTSVSRSVHDQMVSYLPALTPRASVLYNGHPAPNIAPAAYPTTPQILFVGRLVNQKRCDLVIAAFARLLEHHPNAHLTIAGDGTEREQLRVQAASLGDKVEFIGWVPPNSVHALINKATLVVIPSTWEGLPNVAMEAAIMARPVIATNIPGMCEVVLDGKTGILVEAEDVEGLAEAMAYLIEEPDQAAAMGQAAHTWAQKQFTLVRCADEYEALYERSLNLYRDGNLLLNQ